jgi:Ser/Thr protein kinase RdoA (MazF antagonist)
MNNGPGGVAPRLQPSDLRFDPPEVHEDLRRALLRQHWELEGSLDRLDGERDQNTRVTTRGGDVLVLKIASASEDRSVAEFQCAALDHLAQADPELLAPRVVHAVAGDHIIDLESDGVSMSARLLTFLPGVTFDSAGSLEPDALVGVGASQGRLASAFRGFEHPAATNFMAWSLDSGMIANEELWTDLSPEGRASAAPYRERVESAASLLAGARRQIVHNDGHRGNLLRQTLDTTEVIGVIDFGDIAETAVIADLAICGASFVDRHPNQRAALCSIATGYHSAMPLNVAEIDLLADLVLTRIVLGLLLVEYQSRHAPPHRLAEIAGELPSYRENMSRWGKLDPSATTDALHRQLDTTER